jgi:hypothetical protein
MSYPDASLSLSLSLSPSLVYYDTKIAAPEEMESRFVVRIGPESAVCKSVAMICMDFSLTL